MPPTPRASLRHPEVGVLFWASAAGTVAFGLWITGLLGDAPFVLGFLQLLVMAYVVFAAAKAALAKKREDRNGILGAHALAKHCKRTLGMVDLAVRDMGGPDRVNPLLDRLYGRLDAILAQYGRYLGTGAADIVWDAENSIMEAMASQESSPRVLVAQLEDSLAEIDSLILDVDSPDLRHRRNTV